MAACPYTVAFYNSFDHVDFESKVSCRLKPCGGTHIRDTGIKEFGASSCKIEANGGAYFLNTGSASFFAGGNSDVGTMSLFFRPNYTGTPALGISTIAGLAYSSSCGVASTNNRLRIRHLSDGKLYVLIRNEIGTNKVVQSFAWSPTANTQYHFELDWDGSGATRFFIDGVQQFLDLTTFSRSDVTKPCNHVMFNSPGPGASTYWVDDFWVLDGTVLHTGSFTPPTVAGPPGWPCGSGEICILTGEETGTLTYGCPYSQPMGSLGYTR